MLWRKVRATEPILAFSVLILWKSTAFYCCGYSIICAMVNDW